MHTNYNKIHQKPFKKGIYSIPKIIKQNRMLTLSNNYQEHKQKVHTPLHTPYTLLTHQ